MKRPNEPRCHGLLFRGLPPEQIDAGAVKLCFRNNALQVREELHRHEVKTSFSMCDFSCYGGPSQEWLAVQKTLPAPAPPGTQTVQEKRDIQNRRREEASASALQELAHRIRMKDYAIPTRDGSTIEARSYMLKEDSEQKSSRLPVYLHAHGGGYLYGTLSSEDAACARVTIGTGVVVLNVNYRHTPEHTYPTAWNDVEDAYLWLQENIDDLQGDANKVIVGGISAGAQMTASLTLSKHLGTFAQSHPPLAGQLLMIPCLAHAECYDPQLTQMKDASISSYVENRDAPVLPMSAIRMFLDLLNVDKPDVNDLRLNPGNVPADKAKGMPPTVFGISGLDPLRDEGLLYAKKLSEANVPTDINVFKGLPHGFRRFGDQLTACKRWDAVIENGIRWMLGKPQATGRFTVNQI